MMTISATEYVIEYESVLLQIDGYNENIVGTYNNNQMWLKYNFFLVYKV